MKKARFHYPGEYIYKGIVYHDAFPVDVLKDVEERLTLAPHQVVIESYPKSGTTWMTEIVYQIQHGGLLTSGSFRTPDMNNLYPYIDMRWPEQESPVQKVILNPNISGIRTHLTPDFFDRMLKEPTTCPKFIVVERNPKDVLISYYHYETSLPRLHAAGLNETFDEFFERYKDNGLVFGNSIDHIANWWQYKGHPCVHVVMYESILQDPALHIRQIAKFLDYSLTEDDVNRVIRESNVQAMRARGFHAYHKNVEMDESRQSFFRKATVGDWRTALAQNQQDYVDKQIATKLHPLGIHFDDSPETRTLFKTD